MLNRIKELSTSISSRLVEIRRHIHAHPELSGEEYQTAAFIAG
ncbi:MAG: hydrolase, partial [Dolichospermum sp.]